MKKNKEPLQKRLLTVQETSVYLGRSVTAIRELIWTGTLPAVKCGRRIHCDIFDLERWIEQHKTTQTF
jgi:excisionase family DNA binding protein